MLTAKIEFTAATRAEAAAEAKEFLDQNPSLMPISVESRDSHDAPAVIRMEARRPQASNQASVETYRTFTYRWLADVCRSEPRLKRPTDRTFIASCVDGVDRIVPID